VLLRPVAIPVAIFDSSFACVRAAIYTVRRSASTSADTVCHIIIASSGGSNLTHETKRRQAAAASRLRSCGHLPLACVVAARQRRTFDKG